MNNNKIAVIGAGYWGSIITKTLISLKFKKVVIHDINKKNLKIIKKKFNEIIIEKNFLNILNDKEIESVIVATPPSANFNIIKQLLLNNKNIFLEKPGFKNLNDLKRIKKINSKNKIMIGYVYCYNNYIKKIKEILKSKELGKILYINLRRQNLGPIRNDVDVDYDLTSHDLSIIIYLFNKNPRLISFSKNYILKKNIADISNLHFRLDNIFIDINNSWINPTKERLIKIIGSKKMLIYDEMNLKEPLKIFNQYANYPKLDFFDKKFLNFKAYIYKGKSKIIHVNAKSPLENELRHFFTNKKPLTNLNFAEIILKILKRI